MKRLLLCVAILALAPAAFARKPTTRAGVDPAALAPAGLERLSVTAPGAPGLPVRLAFGTGGKPQVLIDVTVTAGDDDARAALANWRRTVQRTPDEVLDLGDEAYAAPSIVGFARANVTVVVRRLAGDADVRALADQAAAAIDAAPFGSPFAAPVAVKGTTKLTLDAAPLASRLEVTGPATARKTAQGWVLTRTGAGSVAVHVVAVDQRLRVTK